MKKDWQAVYPDGTVVPYYGYTDQEIAVLTLSLGAAVTIVPLGASADEDEGGIDDMGEDIDLDYA